MSTKKRRNTNSQHRDNTVGAGMTAKQRRRKRPINNSVLVDVEPITDNQKLLFNERVKVISRILTILLILSPKIWDGDDS